MICVEGIDAKKSTMKNVIDVLLGRSSINRVQRGMPSAKAWEILSTEFRIAVQQLDSKLAIWEVWASKNEGHPVAEVWIEGDQVHSIDTTLSQPFHGEAVDFVEVLFNAATELCTHDKRTGKQSATVTLVLNESTPPDAQQRDIGIWFNDNGITIRAWIKDEKNRFVEIKKSR